MQNMLDYSVIKRQRGADGEWWSGKYGAAVDRMPPEQLHDLFRRGFSVVLNRLNYRHPRVAALSAALSEVFGHRVNCNMCVGEETRRETRREKREKRKHLSSYLHVCMCVCVKTETRRDMDLLPVVCLSACARMCGTIENEGRLHRCFITAMVCDHNVLHQATTSKHTRLLSLCLPKVPDPARRIAGLRGALRL